MMIIMRTLPDNVKSQVPAFGSAPTDARIPTIAYGSRHHRLYQGDVAARAAAGAGRRLAHRRVAAAAGAMRQARATDRPLRLLVLEGM
jgi:hypothetical protein